MKVCIPKESAEGERRVALSQSRVAALLDVALRPAEPAHQKVTQALLGAREILGRIHRTQHVVRWDLAIKRTDEPREALFPDCRVDVLFFHATHIMTRR